MKKITIIGLLLASAMLLTTESATARSLWTEDSPMNFMMTEANASKVGDILMIVVQEDNRANESANGEGKREQKVNGIFGMLWNNPFMQKVFGGAENAPQVKWDSNNEFTGEAAVDRANTFTSRIAATIVRIDPTGNYLVEARKTIHIGEERKTIVLSGKIRPRDIVRNSILSWQVADAEISYIGSGTLGKMSNPTFFQKIFNVLF